MDLALSAPLRIQRPDRLLIWSVVGAAWVLTVLIAVSGSPYMVDHDGVLGERDFSRPVAMLLFLGSWQLMTAAMMLPTSLPMMAMFLRVARRHPRPRAMFLVFNLGYFAVWTGFSVVALAHDAVIHQVVDRVAMLAEHQYLIGGALLILAGAFQFSSLKERCLDSCRNPVAFFLSFYAPGSRGAWRTGLRHGLFCLGCCWALMLTMFAVGVGSLAWMTALTGVMLIEKTARFGKRLAHPVGFALIVWGVLVVLNLSWLPSLLRTA
jgi:predicted metal-binding membrane protein